MLVRFFPQHQIFQQKRLYILRIKLSLSLRVIWSFLVVRIACFTWKTFLCLNCCFTSFSSLKPYINAPPPKINTMHQVFIILDCRGQTIKAYHIQVQSSRARWGKNTIMCAFIFFIFQILDFICAMVSTFHFWLHDSEHKVEQEPRERDFIRFHQIRNKIKYRTTVAALSCERMASSALDAIRFNLFKFCFSKDTTITRLLKTRIS